MTARQIETSFDFAQDKVPFEDGEPVEPSKEPRSQLRKPAVGATDKDDGLVLRPSPQRDAGSPQRGAGTGRLNLRPCPCFCLRQEDAGVAILPGKIDNLLEGALAGRIAVSTPLTKCETQILQSILAGQTNKQIARALCRSRRTIEYHRNRLMQKLNAHNAAELIRGAITMGLV